jgi:hypothetical protein
VIAMTSKSMEEDQSIPLSTSLDIELRHASVRRLYVVPTTRVMLDSIPRWLASNANPHVVSSTTPGMTPQQLLARLNALGADSPVVAIVFSDQLTSPVVAPVLTEHSGTLLYLSALEFVVQHVFQFDIHVWTGGGFAKATSRSSSADILRLLHRYLVACETLGPYWLARPLQADRYIGNRAQLACLRLRAFHSAIMHAYRNSAPPPAAQHLIGRIIERQRSLSDLRV